MLLIVVFATAVAAVAVLAFGNPHIRSIFYALRSRNGQLSFSPTQLSGLDSTFIVLQILSKYIFKFLGQAPNLSPTSNGNGLALPPLSLEAPLKVGANDIKKFEEAVGGDKHVNYSSPLLLAAVTTPMMLILLSNSGCPILPFGAVNTKNRFEFLDPDACRRALQLEGADVQARLGSEDLVGRRVKRGMEFDVVIEVKANITGSKSHRVIFRQIISILVFLPKNTKPIWTGEAGSATTPIIKSFNEPEQVIDLTSDAPKAWSKVCNDINPIHMSSLAARLFGFPGKIAHGNHVVAIVIERLSGCDSKDEMHNLIWDSQTPSFVEVAFKRPMVLPVSLNTKFEVAGGGRSSNCFEVVGNDGKTHIEGCWGVLNL